VNVSGSEYVNVPADNISSWCTSSRGIIFTWRADIEQCKVSDIPSRNSETNNFQNNNNNNSNNDNNNDVSGLRNISLLRLIFTHVIRAPTLGRLNKTTPNFGLVRMKMLHVSKTWSNIMRIYRKTWHISWMETVQVCNNCLTRLPLDIHVTLHASYHPASKWAP
jgi:hypothetical protein